MIISYIGRPPQREAHPHPQLPVPGVRARLPLLHAGPPAPALGPPGGGPGRARRGGVGGRQEVRHLPGQRALRGVHRQEAAGVQVHQGQVRCRAGAGVAGNTAAAAATAGRGGASSAAGDAAENRNAVSNLSCHGGGKCRQICDLSCSVLFLSSPRCRCPARDRRAKVRDCRKVSRVKA